MGKTTTKSPLLPREKMMRWTMLLLISLFATQALGYGIAYAERVHVKGTTTKTGTYRQPHNRTSPNSTKTDNWSTKGNVNPWTGKKGTKNPY